MMCPRAVPATPEYNIIELEECNEACEFYTYLEAFENHHEAVLRAFALVLELLDSINEAQQ